MRYQTFGNSTTVLSSFSKVSMEVSLENYLKHLRYDYHRHFFMGMAEMRGETNITLVLAYNWFLFCFS
jgi:hypothetical protein